MRRDPLLVVRDAEIDYTNFKGEASEYNAAGCKNFCIIFRDLDLVNKMKEDGWNMKPYKLNQNQDDDGNPTAYYTQINVAYGSEYYPDPDIVLVSDGGRKQTHIDEEIATKKMDSIYYTKIDLRIRLRRWTDKKTQVEAIKGYLHSMYVWLEEDDLDAEYNNMLHDDNEPVEEIPF